MERGCKAFADISIKIQSLSPRRGTATKTRLEGRTEKIEGRKIKVTIIASDQKENKLIFSEKKQRYGGIKGYEFQIQNRRHC